MTLRCVRSEFRLRPDRERSELFAFLLARALRACPEIHLEAAVQMSNHFHLVLRDMGGRLSNFMCRLAGPVARAINRMDGYTGQVFERRFSAIEIVDRLALIDRIAYVVMNPISAGLVAHPEAWPGLLLWHGGAVEALGRRPRIRRGQFEVEEEIASLAETSLTDEEMAEVVRLVESRREELEEALGGHAVRGPAAVMHDDVFNAPARPARKPMPSCHASSVELWEVFRQGWRAFVEAYRRASDAFRRGDWDAPFPDHCFRPWVAPLMVARTA